MSILNFLKKVTATVGISTSLLTDVFDEQSVDEQSVIEQIHNEFDTAADRLLEQANKVLSEIVITPEKDFEGKALRLRKLGFSDTKLAQQLDSLERDRKVTELKMQQTKEDADIVQHYKSFYPNLLFLTDKELNRICTKYSLIYAPVENFIGDVPDKNLNDIENAQKLNTSDFIAYRIFITINKFDEDCPSDLQKILSKGFYLNQQPRGDSDDLDGFHIFTKAAFRMGYTGNFDGWVCNHSSDYKVHFTKVGEKRYTCSEPVPNLFICAPPKDFNLKGLTRIGEFGNLIAREISVNDPIVFRYVRGGIQVLSKWGLEAKDELLINETNN